MRAVEEAIRATGRRETAAAEAEERHRRELLAIDDADDGPAKAAAVMPLAIAPCIRVGTKEVSEGFCARQRGRECRGKKKKERKRESEGGMKVEREKIFSSRPQNFDSLFTFPFSRRSLSLSLARSLALSLA